MKLGYKRSQSSVNYSKGMKSSHCGICEYFREPDACAKVSGKIDPAYWCELFKKKV